MSIIIQKGEIVAPYRRPQLFGVFTEKKTPEGLWEVFFHEKKCSGWFLLKEIFTRKIKKFGPAECTKCKKSSNFFVNCNISRCSCCLRTFRDHRTRKCCFQPMYKMYLLKCTNCFKLILVYKSKEDQQNHQGMKHTKESLNCAQNLVSLSKLGEDIDKKKEKTLR